MISWPLTYLKTGANSKNCSFVVPFLCTTFAVCQESVLNIKYHYMDCYYKISLYGLYQILCTLDLMTSIFL